MSTTKESTMKKYKHNYMFTPMFNLCNIFLSCVPMIAIMILSLDIESAKYLPLFVLFMIGFFIVLGNVVHFIICIFSKHTVFIEDNTLTHKSKKILTQSINLDEVSFVIFDQGIMGKVSSTPCSLTLYNNDYTKRVYIKNPSFFLIVEINKRCKNAKFKFNNYKHWIITAAIGIAIGLSILFLGTR